MWHARLTELFDTKHPPPTQQTTAQRKKDEEGAGKGRGDTHRENASHASDGKASSERRQPQDKVTEDQAKRNKHEGSKDNENKGRKGDEGKPKKPPQRQEPTRVTRVIVAHRTRSGNEVKVLLGMTTKTTPAWELLGGRIEEGETPAQAASRELLQEGYMWVDPPRWKTLGTKLDPTGRSLRHFLATWTLNTKVHTDGREHSALEWTSVNDAISKLSPHNGEALAHWWTMENTGTEDDDHPPVQEGITDINADNDSGSGKDGQDDSAEGMDSGADSSSEAGQDDRADRTAADSAESADSSGEMHNGNTKEAGKYEDSNMGIHEGISASTDTPAGDSADSSGDAQDISIRADGTDNNADRSSENGHEDSTDSNEYDSAHSSGEDTPHVEQWNCFDRYTVRCNECFQACVCPLPHKPAPARDSRHALKEMGKTKRSTPATAPTMAHGSGTTHPTRDTPPSRKQGKTGPSCAAA